MVDIVYLQRDGDERRVAGTDVTVITTPATSAHPLAAQLCAEIHRHRPAGPLVFIVEAELAQVLPNIALAQRTAHRAVAGYVLINPDLGPPSLDWPDAPVLVLGDTPTARRNAELRGWQFDELTDDWERRARTFAADVTPL